MLDLVLKNNRKLSHILIALSIFMAISFRQTIAQDHENQATKYFFLKDYDNAIKEYKLALEQHPKNPQLYYNIGTCYNKLGDDKIAIDFYDKALKLQPDFTKARQALEKLQSESQRKALREAQISLQKADNAFKLRNYNQAIRQYTKVIQIDTYNFAAFFNLAFCYEQKENYVYALRYYKQALALNKSSEKTRAAIRRSQALLNEWKILELKTQIEVELRENKLEKARGKVNKILAIDPENSWALARHELINEKLQHQTTTSDAQPGIEETTGSEKINKDKNESSTSAASPQDNTLNYIYFILGFIIISGAVVVFLIFRHRKKNQVAEDQPQNKVYGLLEEYYHSKKTGMLSATGTKQNGEDIQGEVKVHNGNIVNATTNNLEGVEALNQLFELEQFDDIKFQEFEVASEGNVQKSTLTILIQWAVDTKNKLPGKTD